MGTTYDFDMPLREAMETQRAIRRLAPDPVDDALVLRLIELALKAPTSSVKLETLNTFERSDAPPTSPIRVSTSMDATNNEPPSAR